MNYAGCKRKFDIKAYVAYVDKAVAEVGGGQDRGAAEARHEVLECVGW